MIQTKSHPSVACAGVLTMTKRSWLIAVAILFITGSFTVGQSTGAQWNTPALQRLMHEWDVKLEKMELHLQPAMRRAGVDMWIIMSREFNVDPMLQMLSLIHI